MADYSDDILNTLEAMLESCPDIPDDLKMIFRDRKRMGVCSDLYQTIQIDEDLYEVSVRRVTSSKILGE